MLSKLKVTADEIREGDQVALLNVLFTVEHRFRHMYESEMHFRLNHHQYGDIATVVNDTDLFTVFRETETTDWS